MKYYPCLFRTRADLDASMRGEAMTVDSEGYLIADSANRTDLLQAVDGAASGVAQSELSSSLHCPEFVMSHSSLHRSNRLSHLETVHCPVEKSTSRDN